MARADDRDSGQGRRRARPGPYQPPADRRLRPERADLELARHAAISLRDAQRVDVDVRDQLLEALRAQRIHEHNAERAQLWQRIQAVSEHGSLHDADA